jgi:hypothetical protein
MNRRFFRFLLLSLAALVALRYVPFERADTAATPPTALSSYTEDLLLEGLQLTAYQLGSYWEPVSPSRVSRHSKPSAAIPGLTYHWAFYRL